MTNIFRDQFINSPKIVLKGKPSRAKVENFTKVEEERLTNQIQNLGPSGSILSNQRASTAERQPHIYGAKSGQYRSGIAVTSARSAPPWDPSSINENTLLPYTAEGYIEDLRMWLQATDVSE